MKILISVINYKFLTGAELYVYELSKQLKSLGHEVLITSRVVGGEISEASKSLGIEVYDFNECPTDWNPDILHVNELAPSAFAMTLYPSVRVVATIHSQYTVEKPFISERIYKYICIRPEVQQAAIENYGIPKRRTELIYNGVDFTRFKKTVSSKQNKRNVLFVGTIDPLRKNSILHIIDKSQKEKFQVTIVGDKHSDYLDKVPDNVKVYPATWNIEDHLKGKTETAGVLLGRTTIEGWAAGLPGWIYDIDLEGNIKNVDLYEPPKDLESHFNIVNVANSVLRIYKGALLNKSLKNMNQIALDENMKATSLAVGATAIHEYHMNGFNNLFADNEIIHKDHERRINELIREHKKMQDEIQGIYNSVLRIINSKPYRLYSKIISIKNTIIKEK